ncbi:hypothetical protein BC830DRAFT_1084713 [Chytriomyces sp. MP71]|nr:hypothetical protein BC830DRAFT_1084713 [Chytriomyces sp. MP71]
MADPVIALNYTTFGNFILAMAFENNLRGCVSAISKVLEQGPVTQSKTTATLILWSNVLSMCTIVTFATLRPFNPDNCVILGEVNNISFHVYLVSFGAFLLYKAWIITSKNMWFLTLSVVLLLTRTSMGLYDLRVSYYLSEPKENTCTSVFSETSPILYVSADIVIDLVCTVAACVTATTHLNNVSLRTVFAVFATENILRSTFMMADNILNLYLFTVGSTSPAIYFCFGLQMYIAAQALNSEFWWIGVRTQAVVAAMGDVERKETIAISPVPRSALLRPHQYGSSKNDASGYVGATVGGGSPPSQAESPASGFRIMRIYNYET